MDGKRMNLPNTIPESHCPACGSQLVLFTDWTVIRYGVLTGEPTAWSRQAICPKHPGRHWYTILAVILLQVTSKDGRLDAFNRHAHFIETLYADPSKEPSVTPVIWR